MDLVVIHGPPGIGKHTIATEVAAVTGYPILSGHQVFLAVSPVFEWSTPAFYEVRNTVLTAVIERARAEDLPGLIATVIFEPSFPVDAVPGPVRLFAGLQCERDEHARRAADPSRAQDAKVIDRTTLDQIVDSGIFELPAGFPAPSIVIDTTGRHPADVAAEIVTHLTL